MLWARLFLASAYGNSGRAGDAATASKEYSAARVRQGGLPFVMSELQGPNPRPQDLKPPEKARLIQGLRSVGIPYNYNAKEFAKHRLIGSEIEALFFGHRIHGRSLATGVNYGMYISPDGTSAMAFGDWGNGTGTARVDNDHLCFVQPATEWCPEIFRNPGGTRARENEFYTYLGWAHPFSQVQ
jgi:adenylate cyclase